jgi:hypothetical protein
MLTRLDWTQESINLEALETLVRVSGMALSFYLSPGSTKESGRGRPAEVHEETCSGLYPYK